MSDPTRALMSSLEESLGWRHERVELIDDEPSGLRAVIAIHSTTLGPALGGLRVRAYERGLPEALDDALRLSRAMTLKASAAGLDLGGGKSVILDDGRAEMREPRLAAMARAIDRLAGSYITAEDLGTTTRDMDLIAEHTEHVVGRSRRGGIGGDPSPSTAQTVMGAIGASLEVLDGDDGFEDRVVGVIGLGKVGARLAMRLAGAGARVLAFDTNREAARVVSGEGVEIVDQLGDLLTRPLDVLAPCAVGGMIDDGVAARLSCRVVCGAANNPLAGAGTPALLAGRGILYVPDFLANCGGLIHADSERRGAASGRALETALANARSFTRDVLLEASGSGRLPFEVAEEHAWRRIERVRAERTASDGSAGAVERAVAGRTVAV